MDKKNIVNSMLMIFLTFIECCLSICYNNYENNYNLGGK